jgi:hypothetical protein
MKKLITGILLSLIMLLGFSQKSESVDLGVSAFGINGLADNIVEAGIRYQSSFTIQNYSATSFNSPPSILASIKFKTLDSTVVDSINLPTFNITNLNASATLNLNATFVIPSSIAEGNYLICMTLKVDGDTIPENDSYCMAYEIVSNEHDYAILGFNIPEGDDLLLSSPLFFNFEFKNNAAVPIKQGTVIRFSISGVNQEPIFLNMSPLTNSIAPGESRNYEIAMNQGGNPILVSQVFSEGQTPTICVNAILGIDANPSDNQFCNTFEVRQFGTSVQKLSQSLELNVYPNPLTSANAKLDFYLNSSENVTFKVYDINGRMVQSIDLGYKSSGNHTESIALDMLSNGTYIYTVSAGSGLSSGRLQISR